MRLLQLDGYESYLNALKSIDTDGHIKEVVSPGDCTDLYSTIRGYCYQRLIYLLKCMGFFLRILFYRYYLIDQEVGSFIKQHFNKAFRRHFKANPDRWQLGKVPARERRQLFTVWVGDAVDALMERRDIITRAFRCTGVGIDIDGKERDHQRYLSKLNPRLYLGHFKL